MIFWVLGAALRSLVATIKLIGVPCINMESSSDNLMKDTIPR